MKNSNVIVSNLDEYLSWIERLTALKDVLFRGQPENKPLLPKIARYNLGEQLCDIERKLFREFKRQAHAFGDMPKRELDLLAVARHHGLPTRLLDWTANPLAALWFAIKHGELEESNGVVWALRPESSDYLNTDVDIDIFSVKRTRIYQPIPINKRIIAQAAWFTIHACLNESSFVSLENNKFFKNKLHSMTIPTMRFDKIAKQLDRCGINNQTMYMDLDGLSQHLEWKFVLKKASILDAFDILFPGTVSR